MASVNFRQPNVANPPAVKVSGRLVGAERHRGMCFTIFSSYCVVGYSNWVILRENVEYVDAQT